MTTSTKLVRLTLLFAVMILAATTGVYGVVHTAAGSGSCTLTMSSSQNASEIINAYLSTWVSQGMDSATLCLDEGFYLFTGSPNPPYGGRVVIVPPNFSLYMVGTTGPAQLQSDVAMTYFFLNSSTRLSLTNIYIGAFQNTAIYGSTSIFEADNVIFQGGTGGAIVLDVSQNFSFINSAILSHASDWGFPAIKIQGSGYVYNSTFRGMTGAAGDPSQSCTGLVGLFLIDSCNFTGNYNYGGGACLCEVCESLNIKNTVFIENSPNDCCSGSNCQNCQSE